MLSALPGPHAAHVGEKRTRSHSPRPRGPGLRTVESLAGEHQRQGRLGVDHRAPGCPLRLRLACSRLPLHRTAFQSRKSGRPPAQSPVAGRLQGFGPLLRKGGRASHVLQPARRVVHEPRRTPDGPRALLTDRGPLQALGMSRQRLPLARPRGPWNVSPGLCQAPSPPSPQPERRGHRQGSQGRAR